MVLQGNFNPQGTLGAVWGRASCQDSAGGGSWHPVAGGITAAPTHSTQRVLHPSVSRAEAEKPSTAPSLTNGGPCPCFPRGTGHPCLCFSSLESTISLFFTGPRLLASSTRVLAFSVLKAWASPLFPVLKVTSVGLHMRPTQASQTHHLPSPVLPDFLAITTPTESSYCSSQ